MNLINFRNLSFERKLALIFGALGFILTFRFNSLTFFIGFTVFSGLIGYILALTSQRIKKKIYRYPIYVILLLLFTVPILAIFYIQYQGCLANVPYEAKNIFTGETKTFIHGGCGARTEHPWFYRITDTNAGGLFSNQTR